MRLNVRWRVASRIVLVLTAIAGITGILMAFTGGKVQRRSFEITFSYHRTGPDGSIISEQTWIEKVTASGKVKTVRYSTLAGNVEPITETSETGRSWNAPEYSPELWRKFTSARFLRDHPQLDREEEICGLRAYVLWQDTGVEVVERWYAIETGPVPLKTVVDLGQEGRIVAEAVKINFRDIEEAELEK